MSTDCVTYSRLAASVPPAAHPGTTTRFMAADDCGITSRRARANRRRASRRTTIAAA
jgi:hypothetical protein